VSVADDIAAALKGATKDLHAEKKRRERDARRVYRPRPQPVDRVTIRDAVFAVMADAITAVSGDGTYPFDTRSLYYQVRPRIQRYTSEKLEGSYFSQALVVAYEREHGPIPGHYRHPRGELHEPHRLYTSRPVVRLGTREVAAYQFPDHTFDKVLYIEKEGLAPIFDAARLADRYDLAVAYGKGQPAEAVRALFERAEAGDYRLFVLHDADPDGYSIARVMAEETERMPGYSVDVVDLGLTVGDAVGHRPPLEPEAFTRRKELPWWMPARLTDLEREWFEGRLLTQAWATRRQWACTRVELNALAGPDLIAYIEAGLERHGAAGKIVPPPDVLTRQAVQRHRAAIAHIVDAYLAERFDTDALAETLAAEFPLDPDADPAEAVAQAQTADRAVWWRTAVDGEADRQVDDADEPLQARLVELLEERLQDQSGRS
jgi:hypothetical protein